MPGLGSYTSLFPGQCTPVMLFVFIDDFCDLPNPSSNVEESTDASLHSQSSSLSGLTRPNLPVNVSGPVVVLARSTIKSEGGLRKKLQSSLEAQVRFLIKKCRILSGLEISHGGSRSGGVSSSAPLFSLDSSCAVVLLDRSANQRGESLEFSTELVEDVLNGKATLDSLLLESHGQSANKEDVTSVKECIFRQCDILRGKVTLTSNSNGTAAGVGMVVAAAALAASGKIFTTPELLNLDDSLSSSQQILHGILSAKGGCLEEIEISKRKPRLRNPQPSEGFALKNMDPLDVVVSWLESGKGLKAKFSTLWCERTLPAAKEFMVKGPAVQYFAKKLEDECTAIWELGRQLCDAVSLTGKPCMHQRHDIQSGEAVLGAAVKSLCSGYVFLHGCACGRSRRLWLDPFDFESANVTSNCFPECDKLLPALQLPKVTDAGPVQPSSWSLIRVGGARYYEPSKGLLQSGFSATQKFLFKWEIILEKQKSPNGLTAASMHQDSAIKLSADPKFKHKASTDIRSTADMQLYYSKKFSHKITHQLELQTRISELNGPSDSFC
ncbi:hypothetical protein L484_012770 [Morus notabilis]|uniref:Nonsense-mediated mRNA decay factor SMG8 n=1 Tax=Morus notabilis TaxID=981085 RepID=W9RVN9_9ROSA|nr:hypothetical protein L484_012770 [Morus notabilis]